MKNVIEIEIFPKNAYFFEKVWKFKNRKKNAVECNLLRLAFFDGNVRFSEGGK